MTVTSIKRDWGPDLGPSIVRLVTTDPVEDVVQTGWLGRQYDDIVAVNHGPFEWKTNDVVLINYDVGSDFFYVFADFLSVNPLNPIYPNLQNVVAHAGGGQALATQINLGINVVEVVATAGDSLKLPDDVLGQTVIVYNRTANACDIFPFLGDSINARAVNTAISLPANARIHFVGVQQLRWASFIDTTA